MAKFSNLWHSHFPGLAEPLLRRYVGKPIHYLEIGVFEGSSACWMLDHILTHPLARYTGVDLKVRPAAWDNLAPYGDRAQVIEGDSSLVVSHLAGKYDVIFVDGDHSAYGALADSVACWRVAAGLIIWDDYGNREQDHSVRRGVQSFLGCLPPKQYRVVLDDYLFAVEKMASG